MNNLQKKRWVNSTVITIIIILSIGSGVLLSDNYLTPGWPKLAAIVFPLIGSGLVASVSGGRRIRFRISTYTSWGMILHVFVMVLMWYFTGGNN